MANPIFGLFRPSPIEPIQAHMEAVKQTVLLLEPFFNEVIANNWSLATTLQGEIVASEHKADALKWNVRKHLPKGLFLPVSRGDLLQMLVIQDLIANKAKDISGLVLGRQMALPASIHHDFMSLIQRSIAAVEQADAGIHELDELLETGFRGNEVSLVENMIQELGHIEEDTDTIQIAVRRALRVIEETLNPIDVIFLYKIIQLTGEIADHAEQVGNSLLQLLAQ
ncbi:MAG: TIGR00153 family protein [Gammaproteobacteria bacterium]